VLVTLLPTSRLRIIKKFASRSQSKTSWPPLHYSQGAFTLELLLNRVQRVPSTTAYSRLHLQRIFRIYGAPLVKILYLTDLAQKLLSLRISSAFSYLCVHLAISAQR